MIKSVAVIGVGAMGAPMAQHIHDGGFELTVCDRSETALARFAEQDVRTTQVAADCRDADLVIVLVATPDQMWEVVNGEHGLTSAPGEHEDTIVAVMSTVNPGPVRELQTAVRGAGIHLIDAPVSGGVYRAQQGVLTVMMGGGEADLASVRPVFETFGQKMFTLTGGLGAAQTVKIVNNMLGVVNYLVVAEAYRIGVEHGLTLPDITSVLEVSTGRNFMSADPQEAPKTFAAYAGSTQASETLASILRKDIHLANALAGELDAEFPVTEGLLAIVDSLDKDSFANWAMIGGL